VSLKIYLIVSFGGLASSILQQELSFFFCEPSMVATLVSFRRAVLNSRLVLFRDLGG
jgi:hypothetical protein